MFNPIYSRSGEKWKTQIIYGMRAREEIDQKDKTGDIFTTRIYIQIFIHHSKCG